MLMELTAPMTTYLLHNATVIDGTGAAPVSDAAVIVDGDTGALTVTYHGADGAPIPGAKLALEPAARR